MVNGVSNAVTAVAVNSNVVKLTLTSAIKYGDVITASYIKPATNPLQTTAGGIAAAFSSRAVTNNLASPTKDVLPITMTMSVTPSHVHKTMSILLTYSSALTTAQVTAMTPEIMRITDSAGKLKVEKLLTTGTTQATFALNLYPGIYNVTILANGVQMVTKRIYVY
jgi:hypothetical protein